MEFQRIAYLRIVWGDLKIKSHKKQVDRIDSNSALQ